jgi:hypothetical protein
MIDSPSTLAYHSYLFGLASTGLAALKHDEANLLLLVAADIWCTNLGSKQLGFSETRLAFW